ncbi:MAG: glycosyltransferase [Candidatus Eisenbacteria bacterium]|nr:glycosyltransferase [Candidatus Eisenbacteria bacterium]
MSRIRLGVVMVNANIGGTELSLLRLLRRYPRPEFEPHLCVLSGRGPLIADFEAAGVPVTALGAAGPMDLPRLLGLRDWIRATNPDILHGYLYAANLLVRMFGREGAPGGTPGVPGFHRGIRRRIVISIHGIDRWRASVHNLIESTQWAKADAVVTGSEAARQATWERFGRSVPVHLVRNSIEPLVCPPRDVARARLGLGEEPVVLCVANLIVYKQHRELIHAFQQVALGVPGARLLLAGQGPMLEPCRRLAARLGIAASVDFLGSRRDIADLYAACDVVALASSEESTPNTLYEAAFAARPVVATAVGGVPELVVDGETGVLVPVFEARPMADALIALLWDAERRARMGAAAAAHAQRHFRLEREVEEMVTFYRTLMAAAR